MLADTVLVDNLREALFPDSTLPNNEDRHIRWSHLDSRANGMIQKGTITYNAEAMLDLLNIDTHL